MWNFSHESGHRVIESGSKSSSRSTCIVPETTRCWSREDGSNQSHGQKSSSLHYLPTQSPPSPAPSPTPVGRERMNTGIVTGAFSVASTRNSPSVPLPQTSAYLYHPNNMTTGLSSKGRGTHREGAEYTQNITKIANKDAEHRHVTLLRVSSAAPPSYMYSPSPSPEPTIHGGGRSFSLEKRHYHNAPPPPMTAEEAVGRKKADAAQHMDPLSQLLALGSGSVSNAKVEPNFRPKLSPPSREPRGELVTHVQHGHNYTTDQQQGATNTAARATFYNKGEEDDDGERRREGDYRRHHRSPSSPSTSHAHAHASLTAACKDLAVKDLLSTKSYVYPSPWGPMRAYVGPDTTNNHCEHTNDHRSTMIAVAPASAWGCAFSAPVEKISIASNTLSGEAFNDNQKKQRQASSTALFHSTKVEAGEEKEELRGVPRFLHVSTRQDEDAAFAKIPITVSLRRTPQRVDTSCAVVGVGTHMLFTTPARSCSGGGGGGGAHEYRDRSRRSPDQASPVMPSRCLRVASITKETPKNHVRTDARQRTTSARNSLVLSSKQADSKTKAWHPTPLRETSDRNPHQKSADSVCSTPSSASTPRYLSNTTTSSAKTRTRSPAMARQAARHSLTTNSNAPKTPASASNTSKATIGSGRIGAAEGGGDQKQMTDSFAVHYDGGRSPSSSARTSTSHVTKQFRRTSTPSVNNSRSRLCPSSTQQSRPLSPTNSNTGPDAYGGEAVGHRVVDHSRRTSISIARQSTAPAASCSRESSPSFFSSSSFSERVAPNTPSASMVAPRDTTVSAGEMDEGMGWACPVCAALVFGHSLTEASTIDQKLSTSRSASAAATTHVGSETTRAVSAAVPLTELFAHTVRCLSARRALEAFLLKDTFGIVGGRSWGLAEGTDTVEKIVEAIHKKLIRVTRERPEGEGRGEEMGGRGVAGGTTAGDGWITNSGEESRRTSVFVVPNGATGGGHSDAESVSLVDKDATLVFSDVEGLSFSRQQQQQRIALGTKVEKEEGDRRVKTNFSDNKDCLRGGNDNERGTDDRHRRRYSVEEVSSTTCFSQQILPTKDSYARRLSAIRDEYNGIARLCAASIGGVLCPMDGGGLFAADSGYIRMDAGERLGENFDTRNNVDTAASLEYLFSYMCCSVRAQEGSPRGFLSSSVFPNACCVNLGVMSVPLRSYNDFTGAVSRSRRASVESSQGAVIQSYSQMGPSNSRLGFSEATPRHVVKGDSRSSSQGPDIVSGDISQIEAQIEALRRLALPHPSVSENSDSRALRTARPLIFFGGDAAFEKRIRRMAAKRLEVLSRYTGTSSRPYAHRRMSSAPSLPKIGSGVSRTSGDRGQRIPRLTIPLELSAFVQHALTCWSCEVVIVYQGELVRQGFSGGVPSRTPSRPLSSAPQDQSQHESETSKIESAPVLRYISVKVEFRDVCDSLSRRLESAAVQERHQTSSFSVASSAFENSPASKRRSEEGRGGGGVECHDGDCNSESSMASALHVAARDLVSFVRGLPAVSERRVRVPISSQLAGSDAEEECKPLLPENEEEPQLYRCEVLSPHSPHFLSSGADDEGLGLAVILARAFRLRRLPPSVSLLRFFEPFIVLCPQSLTDGLHRVFAEVTARGSRARRSPPCEQKERGMGGESFLIRSQAYSPQRRPLWAD